jgi:hypothetical protein
MFDDLTMEVLELKLLGLNEEEIEGYLEFFYREDNTKNECV